MRFLPILILCAAFLLLQCRSNQAQSRRSYDSLISVSVGKPFDESRNKAKTYCLVQTKKTENAVDYKFAVIDLKKNEVVLDGKFNRGGYVRWLNNTMIEVFSIPKNVETVTDSSLFKRQVLLEGPK